MNQLIYKQNVIADKNVGITVVPISQSEYNELSEEKKTDKTKMYVTSGASSSFVQVVYDLIYPIGKTVIEFNEPTVPAGVTAEWEDVSADYEGRALWISSTEAGGTELQGSLPSISGDMGAYCMHKNSGGLPEDNGPFTFEKKTTIDWAGATGDEVRRVYFDAAKSSAVYSGTDDTVRPTSVTVKVFKRVS